MNHTVRSIDSGSVRTHLILPYGQYVTQYASLVPMNHPTPHFTFKFSSKNPCYAGFLHLSTGECQLNSLRGPSRQITSFRTNSPVLFSVSRPPVQFNAFPILTSCMQSTKPRGFNRRWGEFAGRQRCSLLPDFHSMALFILHMEAYTE